MRPRGWRAAPRSVHARCSPTRTSTSSPAIRPQAGADVAQREPRPAREVGLGRRAEGAQVAAGELGDRGVAVVRRALAHPVTREGEQRLGAAVRTEDREALPRRQAKQVDAAGSVDLDPHLPEPLHELGAAEVAVGFQRPLDRLERSPLGIRVEPELPETAARVRRKAGVEQR